MKLSEEMAVRLHRMMWRDMQRELGNDPSGKERAQFKYEWIHKHFPGESIANDCWLCEYASSVTEREPGRTYCLYCPINWPNRHCNTLDFSYAKEPVSEILALPAKNKEIEAKHDETALVRSYYQYREDLLSKASGRPASTSIDDHVTAIRKKANEEGYETAKEYLAECSGLSQDKLIFDHIKAIQEKAVQQSTFSKMYCDAKTELAKASGLPEANAVTDHIAEIRKKEDRTTMKVLENFSGLKGNGLWIADHVKAIQEKAVEDYFKKTPGAKLATMDVDQAFKQYADEQKAPIFRALAEASGLSAGNESVKAHIYEVRRLAKNSGRAEKCKEIFDELSESSGLSKDLWNISDHVKAIREKAKASMESLRTANMLLVDTLNKYKDVLSKESDLDRNRPVDDHIREIVKNSMEAGATEERDRIQEKIYEVLLS